jgi:S1-C subfamily serine protease
MKRVLTVALAGLAATVAACGSGTKPPGPGPPELTPQQVIARATPAVVQITGRQGDYQVAGTGFIVDPQKGLVVTNHHVIAAAEALRVQVNGQKVPARILGSSECDDVAVLELVRRPEGLRGLAFGETNAVQPGDLAIAMGYPVNLKNSSRPTVTSTQGTISNAKLTDVTPARSIPRLQTVLQSSATVNPGNSGGPLLNARGQVIGMNTLSSTIRDGRIIQGQAYSIASDQLRALLPRLTSGQGINLGWSVVPVRDLEIANLLTESYPQMPRALARRLESLVHRTGGLYVVATESEGPVASADILPGDIVLRINGTRVNSATQYCDVVQSRAPGNKLSVAGYWLDSAKNMGGILTSFSHRVTLPR